ncbi:hypothetical protein J6590_036771 [Homalodisca vitripennis]|nr:hypothetical protein J6590_036771 [Homalodisca vitripennis]
MKISPITFRTNPVQYFKSYQESLHKQTYFGIGPVGSLLKSGPSLIEYFKRELEVEPSVLHNLPCRTSTQRKTSSDHEALPSLSLHCPPISQVIIKHWELLT